MTEPLHIRKGNKGYMFKNINLAKYDVISFDLFDTLIKRDVYRPSDLFKMVGDHFGFDFIKIRIDAERKARDVSSREEVTIQEIYEQIDETSLPVSRIELMLYEMDTEAELCHGNQKVVSFLDRCKCLKKKIIIITDIYLPVNLIKKILSQNNIYYDSLYVSCEEMLTKYTGHLYEFVQKELKISYDRWLHVGDNKKSDFLQARKHGIDSILIKQHDFSKIMFKPDGGQYSRDNLCAFKQNHIDKKKISESGFPYYYHIGYELDGPLLYGFSQWLNKEFHQDQIEKIYFLSRDGLIMQRVYREVAERDIPARYLYGSRRSLIVPTLHLDTSLANVSTAFFWPRFGTIETFIRTVGLRPVKYQRLAEKYNLSFSKDYIFSELFSDANFGRMYDELKEDIYSNSKQEYLALLRYLEKMDFSGRVAVVDIGWHGNMQKAIAKIAEAAHLNVQIKGYYLGLNPYCDNVVEKIIDAKGYLFDSGKNESYFLKERTFTAILEMLFTANHGSVKRFVSNADTDCEFSAFEYSDNRMSDDYSKILVVQNAAVDFIRDIEAEEHFITPFDPITVFQDWIKLGTEPSLQDAENFGSMKIYDDQIKYIANPKNHEKSGTIFSQINESVWRIGMAKRIFKISLPYYSIYYGLRNIYKSLKGSNK